MLCFLLCVHILNINHPKVLPKSCACWGKITMEKGSSGAWDNPFSWNKTCAGHPCAHTAAGWEGGSTWRSKASDHWADLGVGNKAMDFTGIKKIKVWWGERPEQLKKPNSE